MNPRGPSAAFLFARRRPLPRRPLASGVPPLAHRRREHLLVVARRSGYANHHPHARGGLTVRWRPLSTAAAVAPRRTSDGSHDQGEPSRHLWGRSDKNDETDEEGDCLRLKSSDRHCRTCSCHDDDPPGASEFLAAPSPPGPSDQYSREQQQQQQQEPAFREEDTTTYTNKNPEQLALASRLMNLMSSPAASTVLQPPVPAYSVRRRVLPRHLTSLNSSTGRQLLMEAMTRGTSASYLPLTLHFTNQSDPAFCGVTTLLVVLNALSIDPNTRWRGGWRYFGDEESLLARCCLPEDRVKSLGITMDEFHRLASCQGLSVQMKRAETKISDHRDGDGGASNKTAGQPSPFATATTAAGSLEEFRRDVVTVLTEQEATTADGDNSTSTTTATTTTTTKEERLLVVSFGRSGVDQTGDGHFSPIGAYHEGSDQVLVLDVARFKYPPYWVSIEQLYRAMALLDDATNLSRGWFVLTKPASPQQRRRSGTIDTDDNEDPAGDFPSTGASQEGDGEDRRPAHLVPTQKEASWCPMHKVKIEYCQNNAAAVSPPPSQAAAATTPPTPLRTLPQG